MKRVLEVAGYQAVWFAAVLGAARGLAWPGVAAALVFLVAHLAVAPSRTRAVALSATGIACGLLLDGSLARSGAVVYAASWPDAQASIGAPPWILALWAVFPLTLTASLDVLQRRLVLASVVGAVGAPLAYVAAHRMGAWSTPLHVAQVVAVLASGWAVALPLLARIARGSPHPSAAAPWSLPR